MRLQIPPHSAWPYSLVLLILASQIAVQAREDTGSVSGVVVDVETGTALPGARVSIVGTGLATSTGINGFYHLTGIPAGTRALQAGYLGYETLQVEVEVEPFSSLRQDFRLRTLSRESVTVLAQPLHQGQAKALNQQRTATVIKNVVAADQIGRFPDPNAAEAIQRMPGVTLQRNQGEGRFVIVRGTPARLNSVAINGQRRPSPEGDIRFVALDVIPADILESIELTKAPTADMDADAIGGSFNLLTKQAPEDPFLTFSGAWGYNNLVRDDLQSFNLAAGKRFLKDQLGLIFAVSYLRTDRGTDAFEVRYDEGELDEFDLLDFTINRKRLGLVFGIDYRRDTDTESFLNAVFNRFDDRELRRRKRQRVAAGEIVRELKDNFIRQEIASLSFGGKHFFGNLLQFDYTFSYSYSSESEPKRTDSLYVQENVVFRPNVSTNSIVPDEIRASPVNESLEGFEFDKLVREDNFSRDEDFAFAINIARPFVGGDRSNGMWKTGFKYKTKEKQLDNSLTEFPAIDTVLLTSVLDAGFDQGKFLNGRYNIGVFQDTAQVSSILPRLEGVVNTEEELDDYLASEDILAGFALVELNFDGIQLIPGLRLEHTDTSYRGNEIAFDPTGDLNSIQEVRGGNRYSHFLPSVNFRYRAGDSGNLRAAFSRTLARPNHEDLVPFQLLLREDLEIVKGNPDLRPTTSWNYDLLFERYFESVGVFSAGVFFKDMRDNIFVSRLQETRDGQVFDVSQPMNIRSARLFGFETAFQHVYRSEASPFDGLGVYANYTHTSSRADLPGRHAGPDRLPGQAAHVYNLAVSYEKYGFSSRLAWNFHDEYLARVGSNPLRDVFFDRHLQLDLIVSRRLSRHVSVFTELVNLTNEPFRAYEGRADRPIQQEFYSWWGTFGLKFNF